MNLSNNENWLHLEKEMLRLTTIKNQADAGLKEVRAQMQVLSNGENVLGEKVMLTHTTRRGLVQYKEIPAIVEMTTEQLDSFRKPSSTSVVIKIVN